MIERQKQSCIIEELDVWELMLWVWIHKTIIVCRCFACAQIKWIGIITMRERERERERDCGEYSLSAKNQCIMHWALFGSSGRAHVRADGGHGPPKFLKKKNRYIEIWVIPTN